MKLPVGYQNFHKNKFLNYQFNRWYSLGYAREEDLRIAAARTHSFADYVEAFLQQSQQAKQDGRLKNAATYLRAAEFLTAPSHKTKLPIYDEFIELFDDAFSDQTYERFEVPYSNSFLSAIKISSKAATSRGTIVACGGFDSFIEEFYCIWDFFAEQGYHCIAFEGPGQGGSLRKYALPFDHDWEKPTSAVLDYFGLSDVTAIGVSMGGYWIMRAAAFEKRIARVIAMPPVYDWLEMTNKLNSSLAKWLEKREVLLNFLVKLKMKVGIIKHSIDQALFIQKKEQPFEAVEWMLNMNKDHLHSHLIEQDVLLLCGEKDSFQPPILMEKQAKALVNARSVTTHTFLKSDHAHNHCQMGNLGLALQTMHEWLDSQI